MTLYRAVCRTEYDRSTSRVSYDRNREKAFGTWDFVMNRVTDGRFNNTAHKPERYTHLLAIHFHPEYEDRFHKRGPTEWLLNVRKENFPYHIERLGPVSEVKR